MKIYIYLFLCTITVALQDAFIRNLDKPPCIHCKHYLPEPSQAFDASTAKCRMFGGKDTHTGTVLYEHAVLVRQDDVRCSVEGKYFEGEKHLGLKRAGHMVHRTGPVFGFVLFIILLNILKYM
jgi:hypothetical protein